MASPVKQHWSTINEQGGLLGLKVMLLAYRVLGRRFTRYLSYPILFYYYLSSKIARDASRQYLLQLSEYTQTKRLNSFKHLCYFAHAIIDKLAVWNEQITFKHINFPNQQIFQNSVQKKQGGVIFTAHLGNVEILRALSQSLPEIKINSITFTQHAKKFNTLLAKINPKFNLNMLPLESMDPNFAILLQEKVAQGEYIVVAADRTSTTRPGRTLMVDFLGKTAYLPQGAFILAGLLQCPTFFMTCLKENDDQYNVYFEAFKNKINLSSAKRQQSLQAHAQEYSHFLQDCCRQYPLQWFNFFNIWQPQDEKQ